MARYVLEAGVCPSDVEQRDGCCVAAPPEPLLTLGHEVGDRLTKARPHAWVPPKQHQGNEGVLLIQCIVCLVHLGLRTGSDTLGAPLSFFLPQVNGYSLTDRGRVIGDAP